MAQQIYNLNGPTSFFFPFTVFNANQLTVQVVPGGIVPPAEYTVEGVGPNTAGVTVRWPNAPVNGTAQLIITRTVLPQRVTNFRQDRFVSAAALDFEFDNLTLAVNDVKSVAEGALRLGSNLLHWDGKGRRLQNLAPAVANTDAATLGQLKPFADAAAASAANAASSAATAANNAALTAADRVAVQAALVEFRGIYYGPAAADPTTDPFGNPRTVGDLYFNTSNNTLRVWNGTNWLSFNATSLAQLSDVNLAGLVANDLLRYNGTQWVRVPSSNFVPSTRQVLAGGGIVGGGALSGDVVLGVDSTVLRTSGDQAFSGSKTATDAIVRWHEHSGADLAASVFTKASATPAFGALLRLRRARGTIASPTNVLNNDSVGVLDALGWAGSSYTTAGVVEFRATGDFSGISAPTQFRLALNSGSGLVVRHEWKPDGSQFSTMQGSSLLREQYPARVYADWDGSSSGVVIRRAGNVSSITRTATGRYTINFALSLVTADYAVNYNCKTSNNDATSSENTNGLYHSKSATSVQVQAQDVGTLRDCVNNSLVVVRG